jgi:chorismate mutase
MSQPNPYETLADLRIEIDRIDAAMHRLLIERGEIIDRLIAVKARQGGGSAFRPGREAAMMRAIAERHRGRLPLDTVEGIWRIIISTFTYVQSHYSVHADFSGGDAAMRDSVRFHFGFTVPCVGHHGAIGVIDAVARSHGDLGVFRIDGGAVAGAWWNRLIAAEAPKIIARLPFVERPDHPAGMPVFVVAHPLAEAAARDLVLHVVTLDRWSGAIPSAVAALGGEIIGNAGDTIGLSLLIALPGEVSAARLRDELRQGGIFELRLAEVGSHAARYELADRVRPPPVTASATG